MDKNHKHTALSKQNDAASSDREAIDSLRKKADTFSETAGRRPRMLVSGMDASGGDRTIKSVASLFSESGFDVDINLTGKASEGIALLAMENDAHFICVLVEEKTDPSSITELKNALNSHDKDDIRLIVGGDLSEETFDTFYRAGATSTFNITRMAEDSANWLEDGGNEFVRIKSSRHYTNGVLEQNRRIIASAITVVESSLPGHQETADTIINALLPHTGDALRIGISGVPGVGKSTFIECFGMKLVEQGHRVAVLAVDPSSSRNNGSLMGDKTRMKRLSSESSVFIRPSPSGGTLGGVARKTREAMVICEAAGFDVILVETVGVGQSETTVASMVDFFLVMLIAGAGDEIQGIKKGIIEHADCIAINKADGDNIEKAREAKKDYQSALGILCPASPVWMSPVLTCSALTLDGLDEIWKTILDHRERLETTGELAVKRGEQALSWMWDLVRDGLKTRLYNNQDINNRLPKIVEEVKAGEKVSSAAAHELLSLNK